MLFANLLPIKHYTDWGRRCRCFCYFSKGKKRKALQPTEKGCKTFGSAILTPKTLLCYIFNIKYSFPLRTWSAHIWDSGVTSPLANKGSFIRQGEIYCWPRYLDNLSKGIITRKKWENGWRNQENVGINYPVIFTLPSMFFSIENCVCYTIWTIMIRALVMESGLRVSLCVHILKLTHVSVCQNKTFGLLLLPNWV